MEEHSAGFVLYRLVDSFPMFLVLKHREQHWDFPKGHIEPGETEIVAALRELTEETGITDIEYDDVFRYQVEYYFKREGNLIKKRVVYFLGRAKEDATARVSPEHTQARWFSYDVLLNFLRFKEQRDLIVAAYRRIKELHST